MQPRPTSVRVAVDTSPIYVTRAGVARYVNGLTSAFEAVDHEGLAIEPLAWPVHNHDYGQPLRALRTLYREVFWAGVLAPRILRKSGYSILHSTGVPIVSLPVGLKHVVTLHDLAPVRHPERFRRWHLAACRRGFERTRKADKVICISRFTADEGIKLIDLDPSRIEVVPQASDWCDGNLPPTQRPPLELPEDFFLFVGTLEPGKNLQLLREVYSLASARGLKLPSLIVVGVRREGVGEASMSGADDSWIYAGRVSDPELAWLYSRARALVFPSKYEGFGIPLVEAMVMGCPVICSQTTSLGEVAGEAAQYAELTPESFLMAMATLHSDLARRDELIEAGRKRATRYSWKKNAASVVDIYRSLV